MQKLEPGYYYHVFNRGNNKQSIFLETTNYNYFLKLMLRYLFPIANIYCYCLMQNHFHLLLRINDNAPKPWQSFSNMFNAYAKAINKKYNRTGSLFQKPFKRIKIDDENYYKNLVMYIHLNPELHGVSSDFSTFMYSSYQIIINPKNKSKEKDEVIRLFDGLDNFIAAHYINRNKTFQVLET